MSVAAKPVTLLLSGGMDSSVLAADAPKGSVAVFVNWGQPSEDQERAHARATADRFRLLFRTFMVPVNHAAMRVGSGAEGPRVVGGRNLMLIGLAVSVACEMGLETVWWGASLADQADYPDCRHAFIDGIDLLCRRTYGVGVLAPLEGVPRDQIRTRVAELKLATWSCYEPLRGGIPCGTCNACLRT